MISLIRGAYMTAPRVPTLTCLSTDSKPTTNADGSLLANGAILREIDTSKIYRFDRTTLTWYVSKEVS